MDDGKNYWQRKAAVAKMNDGKFTRRRFLAVSGFTAAGLAAAAVVGCGDDDDDDNGDGGTAPTNGTGTGTGAATATGGPVAGGSLVVGSIADAFNMSPALSASGRDHHFHFQLYDGLMEYNPQDLTPEPRLLDSIEEVSDTQLTLNIRPGTMFHDGTELTAEVVKMNLDFIRSADTGSLHTGLVRNIESVEVADDYTVTLNLSQPDAALIDMFAYNPGQMQAAAALEGDIGATAPIGAGPFEFSNRTPADRTDFVKFADYWEQPLPYFDDVSIRILLDDATRVSSLQSGDVDLIIAVPPQSIATLEGDDNFTLAKGVTLQHNKMYIVNTTMEPFSDHRVRKALSLAINRKEILEKVYFNEGALAFGTLTPAQWAYDPGAPVIEQNLAEARTLLEAAGFGDGLEFPAVTYTAGPHLTTAELVQAQFAQIGVNMNIIPGAAQDWAPPLGRGELEGGRSVVFAPSIGAADPDFQYYAYYYPGGQWNNLRHENSEVVALIEQANGTYDRDERIELYRQLDKLIHGVDEDDLSLDIAILYPNDAFAMKKEIEGFVFYGDGKLRTRMLYRAS